MLQPASNLQVTIAERNGARACYRKSRLFNPVLHCTYKRTGMPCGRQRIGCVGAAVSAAINSPFRFPVAINSPSRPNAIKMWNPVSF